MKEIAKGLILLLFGALLGFSAFAGAGIFQRKARNAVFLAEAAAELSRARAAVAAYQKATGRWPSGPADLAAKGLLDPARPPMERLRGSADWVAAWNGQGGFQYSSSSGQVFLNTDLRRQKFSARDWELIKRERLVPPDSLN